MKTSVITIAFIAGGQAKTLMFIHISPELDAVGETISTLKFAERVSMIELGAARINKESAEIKELREEVLSLNCFTKLGIVITSLEK